MTNPPDPGGPPRAPEPPGQAGSAAPGPPGGRESSAYGPPPPPRRPAPGPQGGVHGPPGPTGPRAPVPGEAPGEAARRPTAGGPAWEARPTAPTPENKSVLGALLDVDFTHLVTPRLIKLWYVVALLFISLQGLMLVFFGAWLFQLRNGWLVGTLVIMTTPIAWLFELLLVRIFMEVVVVRFKGVEHLRVIKDKI